MTITRDPEFPAEYAQLAALFNRCADGHEPAAVLNASLQMVSASILYLAKSQGVSFDATMEYANHVTGCILASVQENWRREAKPSDVVVKTS